MEEGRKNIMIISTYSALRRVWRAHKKAEAEGKITGDLLVVWVAPDKPQVLFFEF